MPKIMRDNDDTQDIKESHTENLDIVPSQNIEPPTGD